MHDGFTGLHEKLDSLTHQFGQLQMSIVAPAPKVDRKEILTWLNAVLTDEDYESALSVRLDGTCDWILRRPEVQIWTTPDAAYDSNKILWIHGSPGFGKTILCARLIEHLSSTTAVPISHFFCTGGNDAKRQPRAIVRSWVTQLVNQNEDALEIVRNFYNGKEARKATESDIWQIFRLVSSNIGICFFAIDGYDECLKQDIETRSTTDGRVKFLQDLVAIVKDVGCRVLLVSRNEQYIRNELKNDSVSLDSNFTLEYEITREDTKDDIHLFSNRVVQQGIPKKSDPLKREIASEAALKCDGMFLWIKLMHVRLTPGKNIKQLREVITTTPLGLDQAYERDVRNIASLEDDERDRAIAILRWTLFAERPLTVREMTEALLICDDDTDNDIDVDDIDDVEKMFPWDDLPDEWDEYYTNDQIIRLCGSLIELRKTDVHQPIKDQTIHFVHFSVKEYLLKTVKSDPSIQIFNFSDVASEQIYLARACLRYLCYSDFRIDRHSTSESLEAKMDRYAFYKYAAQSWYYNVVPIEGNPQDQMIPKERVSQELTISINKLFEPRAQRWLLWSEALETANDSFEAFQQNSEDGYPGPQYYAAMIGLTQTVEYLREKGIDLNAKGGRFGNALQVATINGHKDTISYLLSHGAVVNLRGGEYGSAIVAAAAAYHVKKAEAIIKLLIENKADIESKDRYDKTALHLASRYGTLPVIQLLLRNGANVHSVSNFGQTPLQIASVCGHEHVVQVLLEHDSNINHVDNVGWTAMHVAAYNGHISVCKKLLELGANVNIQAEKQLTALHEAAFKGDAAIVELLLDNNADIQSATDSGGTALHLAAYYGHEATAKVLIARRADVNAPNINGWTALHETVSNARFRDHENTVRTLIEGGADINAVNKWGETALLLAISQQSIVIVNILLKHGADCNLADNDQWAPLHTAVAIGNEEILQLLLDSSANVDAISKSGWTPLLFAADRGYDKILKQLLQAGAKPNMRTGLNQTPLHKAVYHGSLAVIQSLLSQGADPLLVDGFGRSSMDWASSNHAIFELMRPYCKEYQQPDPETASAVLHQTLLDNLTELQQATDYGLQIRLINQAGRCLLLLNDDVQASTAFELAIMSAPADPRPMHYAVCGSCNDEKYITGDRYLCYSCAEVDACSACMEKHRAGPFLPTCAGHRFLKVPRDGWRSLGMDTERIKEEWREGLAAKYRR